MMKASSAMWPLHVPSSPVEFRYGQRARDLPEVAYRGATGPFDLSEEVRN